MNEINHKCKFCDSNNVIVEKSEEYDIKKNEWIMLIICGILVFLFKDESDMQFIVYIAYAGIFSLMIDFYLKEKKLKGRFRAHCLDCDKEYFFYENELPSEENNNVPPATENLNIVPEQKNDTVNEIVPEQNKPVSEDNSELENLKFTHEMFVGAMFVVIENISKKIYEKIYINNPALGNKPEHSPEIFKSIRNDLENYFFTGTQKIMTSTLPKKFSINYLGTHEDLKNNLFIDENVDTSTMKNILDDYYKICNEFLRKDLVEYIRTEYSLLSEIDEKNQFTIIGYDMENPVRKSNVEENNLQISRNKEEKITKVQTKNVEQVSDKFLTMYEKAVRKNYSKEIDVKNFLNYGGLNKLRETLFDSEKIILVLNASESLNTEDSSLLKNMLSSDILVLTNKRLIYLRNKLFGTIVNDISLKQFNRIIFEDNTIQFNDLVIYSDKMKTLKEKIYDMM